MASQVHSVVKDADDVDYIPLPCPIHNEMTAPTTSPRNVEGSKIGENFISCGAAEDIWPFAKRGQSVEQYLLVIISLLSPESVLREDQYANKIFLSFGANSNFPDQSLQGASVESERARSPRLLR